MREIGMTISLTLQERIAGPLVSLHLWQLDYCHCAVSGGVWVYLLIRARCTVSYIACKATGIQAHLYSSFHCRINLTDSYQIRQQKHNFSQGRKFLLFILPMEPSHWALLFWILKVQNRSDRKWEKWRSKKFKIWGQIPKIWHSRTAIHRVVAKKNCSCRYI